MRRHRPRLVASVFCRAARGQDRYAVERNEYDVRVRGRIAVQG
jgi:hypothetical protein